MVVPPAFPTWMKYIRGLLGTMIVEDKEELLRILYEEDRVGERYVICSFFVELSMITVICLVKLLVDRR